MASALKTKTLLALEFKGHDIDASIEEVFEVSGIWLINNSLEQTSKKTLHKLSLGATLRTTLPDTAAKRIALCTNLVELRLQGCSLISTRTIHEILRFVFCHSTSCDNFVGIA